MGGDGWAVRGHGWHGARAGMGGGMRRVTSSPGETSGIGLKPERHIAGFSIRKEDGTSIPLIFEAGVGKARDTVVLKLAGPVPAQASLWYGYGLDPYCNLTDGRTWRSPSSARSPLDDVVGSAHRGWLLPRPRRLARQSAGQARPPIKAADHHRR